jgi:catechol 2,3-dioxygenase-like lactoylglutathione lyase family enzyme
MKRFHVHVSVHDLPESVRFYSGLFGARPVIEKADYAKWMLDDPRINFAISRRGRAAGIDHLGFQVESDEELKELHAHLVKADIAALDQTGGSCCYAKSDKYWIEDPQGVAWETFHTLGSVPIYGEESAHAKEGACCIPLARQRGEGEQSACCVPTGKSESKAACCS